MLTDLGGLYPCATLDQRPAPSIVMVLTVAIKMPFTHFIMIQLVVLKVWYPLLLVITDLINLQLEGLTPFSVQSTLFSATLFAISENTVHQEKHQQHNFVTCVREDQCQERIQVAKYFPELQALTSFQSTLRHLAGGFSTLWNSSRCATQRISVGSHKLWSTFFLRQQLAVAV